MNACPPPGPEPFSDPDRLMHGWLTRAELADQLGVAQLTLAKWATQGVGPAFIRVGQRVFYRTSTVRAWMVDLEEKKTRRGRG